MKRETIRIVPKRSKPRMGVQPTRVKETAPCIAARSNIVARQIRKEISTP